MLRTLNQQIRINNVRPVSPDTLRATLTYTGNTALRNLSFTARYGTEQVFAQPQGTWRPGQPLNVDFNFSETNVSNFVPGRFQMALDDASW